MDPCDDDSFMHCYLAYHTINAIPEDNTVSEGNRSASCIEALVTKRLILGNSSLQKPFI